MSIRQDISVFAVLIHFSHFQPSIDHRKGQTMVTAVTPKSLKVHELFPPKEQKASEQKWGKDVMSHGYCIFPSVLLQAQSRLGVNAQEMIVLLQLAEHWWTPSGKVFPKKELIAERVGLSGRQVQRHIQQLEELKLVKRIERYRAGRRTTNEYDLSGLVAKLKSIGADVTKAKKIKAAATKAGGLVTTDL